ncbi:hypothetical protein [Rhizobium glycinendophyticum]|nr:hypothetical protein [Rhizobium glycinendophyticum]
MLDEADVDEEDPGVFGDEGAEPQQESPALDDSASGGDVMI